MKYEVNFGSLATAGTPLIGDCFRIAVLADLSGRANKGLLETGDELATRKPLRVDVDNIDDLIDRLDIHLHLPISDDGGSVKVPLHQMDDFHPDELYENLDVFSKLSGLRSKLADSGSFAGTAKAIKALLGSEAVERHSHLRRTASRGSTVPNAKRSDFASLVGRPSATAETPINNLVKGLIRPHVTADADPAQDQMVATVDEALSDTMRRVLHNPDFQALESVWRCVELLVRRLETDTTLQIVLYDISAEEIAADLCATDDLQETGLYKLFVEQPKLDDQQGALSVLVGNYTFEQTPPHADLLGRMAKIAAAANAPFIASMSTDCLKRVNPEDVHPLVTESWGKLQALPEASYISLVVPRFMLRWPFGKKTEPIDSFEFEEFTKRSGVSGMLWGNSAFLAGLLLGQTFRQSGIKDMKLGSMLGVDDLPFYYFTDDYGDQVALPCTDRLLSERLAKHVTSQNFTPVLSIKGRPEVRLGGFLSLAGTTLTGPWAPGTTASSSGESQAVAPPVSGETVDDEPTADTDDVGDDDLDALLGDLGLDDDESSSDDSDESSADTSDDAADDDDDDFDLDAMLADLGGDDDSDDGDAGDDEMDDDLAALLADL